MLGFASSAPYLELYYDRRTGVKTQSHVRS